MDFTIPLILLCIALAISLFFALREIGKLRQKLAQYPHIEDERSPEERMRQCLARSEMDG